MYLMFRDLRIALAGLLASGEKVVRLAGIDAQLNSFFRHRRCFRQGLIFIVACASGDSLVHNLKQEFDRRVSEGKVPETCRWAADQFVCCSTQGFTYHVCFRLRAVLRLLRCGKPPDSVAAGGAFHHGTVPAGDETL